MKLDTEIMVSVNSEFAKTILQRAAGILDDREQVLDEGNAYIALEQAKDEFIAQEPKSKREQRTYGFKHLSVDLGNFIRQRHPEYTEEWGPINRLSMEVDQQTMVQTLREAENIISNTVAERTRNATKFELMSEKERGEYLVMRNATAFLRQQGLMMQVEWEREDPEKDPIDYWATINGIRWAFEITALRKDAEGSHRKIGGPRSNKTPEQELKELSAPIPKEQDGPEALRVALDNAIKHGNQPAKLEALNVAKYCLLIHNRQFLFEPSWLKTAYPDLEAIDAVLILHIDDLAPARVWEVIPNNGFGQPVKSQNISNLAEIAKFKASGQKRLNREAIRTAWEAIPELDEAEILQAIKDL